MTNLIKLAKKFKQSQPKLVIPSTTRSQVFVQYRRQKCGFFGRNDKIDEQKMLNWARRNASKIIDGRIVTSYNVPYVWNGSYWEADLDQTALRNVIGNKFAEWFDITLMKKQFDEITSMIQSYGLVTKYNSGLPWRNDQYKKEVRITFNNGSLTMDLESGEHLFEYNTFHKDWYAVYKLNYDFEDALLTDTYWQNSFVGNYLMDFYCDTARPILQQYLAGLLLPEFRRQQGLIIIGEGGDGKGVLMNALSTIFAPVVSTVDPSSWDRPFDTSNMVGKILNICSEAPSREISLSKFKSIVACDMLQVERKYQNAMTTQPYTKHIMTVNDMPKIEPQQATMRRLALIKTCRTTQKGQRDTSFEHRFINNKDALISFMLCGLNLLKKNNFAEYDSMEELEKRFVEENESQLPSFIDDCIIITEDFNDIVIKEDVFGLFNFWRNEDGNAIGTKEMNKNTFGQKMAKLFKMQSKSVDTYAETHKKGRLKPDNRTKRCYKGIKLDNEWLDRWDNYRGRLKAW